MKTLENTQNQTVRTSPNMIAKIKNDVKMAQANDKPAEVEADKPETKETKKPTVKKPETKKEPKVRAESNEAIGERLLKEKANEATILATFTKVYKDKAGITDKKFIASRASIYMKIATKRAEAKKAKAS